MSDGKLQSPGTALAFCEEVFTAGENLAAIRQGSQGAIGCGTCHSLPPKGKDLDVTAYACSLLRFGKESGPQSAKSLQMYTRESGLALLFPSAQ